MRYALMPAALALLAPAVPARADILVTLSNGTTQLAQQYTAGNSAVDVFNISGYTFNFTTTVSNYPGTAVAGTLDTTLNVMPNSGTQSLPDLTVQVQDVTRTPGGSYVPESFSAPSPSGGNYDVSNAASLTAPTTSISTLTGSAQVNTGPYSYGSVAPVLVSIANSRSGSTNVSQTIAGAVGYTLAQTFTLTNVSNLMNATATFNTSVQASVPEPSSLVLTGLVSLGLGGHGLRRRLRGRSA